MTKVWKDGHDIRIFGHGTISGDFIPHPNYADPTVRFTNRPNNIVKNWIYLVHCTLAIPRWDRKTSSLSIRSTLWAPNTLGSNCFFFCHHIILTLFLPFLTFSYKFFLLLPAYNSYLFQVEGITIANSAYHSLMLVNSYQPEDPTCDPDFPKIISSLAPIFPSPFKTIAIVTRRSFRVELSKLFKVFVTNEET